MYLAEANLSVCALNFQRFNEKFLVAIRSFIFTIEANLCSIFFLQARTRAIQVPKERTVCLQFSVDTRSRLSPPLPKSFTGNAYVLSSISSTCGDLLQETLTSIVHKIKEAKNAVNDDYVNAYLLALEAPQFTLPALPELTVVSDWSHTPYHKVNFGIGDAVCAVPLAAPLREVVYFMRSSREVGGIDVRIGLMRKHLESFCHYFMEMM